MATFKTAQTKQHRLHLNYLFYIEQNIFIFIKIVSKKKLYLGV